MKESLVSALEDLLEETRERRARERPEADWPRFAAEPFARRFG
ncbi:MAG: hypothetical protein R3199_04100 [Gemmatimonadota bacterium]|nr:hypothetical protein [Gemmatimonadota bacterium]